MSFAQHGGARFVGERRLLWIKKRRVRPKGGVGTRLRRSRECRRRASVRHGARSRGRCRSRRIRGCGRGARTAQKGARGLRRERRSRCHRRGYRDELRQALVVFDEQHVCAGFEGVHIRGVHVDISGGVPASMLRVRGRPSVAFCRAMLRRIAAVTHEKYQGLSAMHGDGPTVAVRGGKPGREWPRQGKRDKISRFQVEMGVEPIFCL